MYLMEKCWENNNFPHLLNGCLKRFLFTPEKRYRTAVEESSRRDIFRNNLKKIEMDNNLHAQGMVTYTLGVNEYADMVYIF